MKPRALLLAALAGFLGACTRAPKGFDAGTYTYLDLSLGETLDPAWASDSTSHYLILNLYEPLFAFDGGSTDKLLARIASKIPTRENGLLSEDGKTYRIPLRKDVRFHDGSLLTPEDARYSLLRFMLQDREGGPSSLLLTPLLGRPSTRDARGRLDPEVFALAQKAVRVDGDDLILTLPQPFPPLASILASCAPAVSKAWAAKNGDWDGSAATWARYNNPKKGASPFDARENGTGPFTLESLDHAARQVTLARFDGYWRAPARLKRVIIKAVEEFATRKLMLQAGEADSILIDGNQLAQVKDLPGVEAVENLPMMQANPILFFNFKAAPLADKDVRLGFAYALDYDGFIRDVLPGTRATGLVPPGLLGYDPAGRTYALDLEKAKEHFQKALGGKIWKQGFTLAVAYNAGNVPREILARILKQNVESLNPKFKVELRALKWAELLEATRSGTLPIFISGWSADYPDPHPMAFALMHSRGNYPSEQGYRNPEADALVDQALRETDAAKRAALYARLQAIEFEDVPPG